MSLDDRGHSLCTLIIPAVNNTTQSNSALPYNSSATVSGLEPSEISYLLKIVKIFFKSSRSLTLLKRFLTLTYEREEFFVFYGD